MVSTSFYHAKLKATNKETIQISFEKTLNPRYACKVIDNCALSNISSMNAYIIMLWISNNCDSLSMQLFHEMLSIL